MWKNNDSHFLTVSTHGGVTIFQENHYLPLQLDLLKPKRNSTSSGTHYQPSTRSAENTTIKTQNKIHAYRRKLEPGGY